MLVGKEGMDIWKAGMTSPDDHLAGNYWFAKLLWGGWWWVSAELLQRLLGIPAWALTLLLLFLSLAACHQRGHDTPNRYWGGGTGDACVLGGNARWEYDHNPPAPRV